MRKYWVIFKTTLLESLSYVMNIALGFVTFFFVLLVFFQLWKYVYTDPSQMISGYTMTQMVWYVTLTETMWFGARNNTLIHQMSNDIRSGGIAYGINKPYHYVLFCIAKNFGDIAVRFTLYLAMGIILGNCFVGSLPGFHFYNLPFIIIAFLAGTLINALIRMTISILSFWVEDAVPFHWLYDKIILVLGTTFPIEMFPAWAQPIMRYSPIYVVTYGPAKLAVDFHMDQFIQILVAQIFYLIGTGVVIAVIYQRGVKKLNVNGG